MSKQSKKGEKADLLGVSRKTLEKNVTRAKEALKEAKKKAKKKAAKRVKRAFDALQTAETPPNENPLMTPPPEALGTSATNFGYKRDELVFKVLQGPACRTGTIERIRDVRDGVAYLGEAQEPDDVNAFDSRTGNAKSNFLMGFYSFLVALDCGVEDQIKLETI